MPPHTKMGFNLKVNSYRIHAHEIHNHETKVKIIVGFSPLNISETYRIHAHEIHNHETKVKIKVGFSPLRNSGIFKQAYRQRWCLPS